MSTLPPFPAPRRRVEASRLGRRDSHDPAERLVRNPDVVGKQTLLVVQLVVVEVGPIELVGE
jgi:hypothetical protein